MLRKLNAGFSVNAGIMNNTEVDSFFYFFSGGMPGIKGYPYYSLEGTSKFISSVFLRRTLFNDKNLKLAWFNLQQSSIGFQLYTANLNRPSVVHSKRFDRISNVHSK